jgi:hypothetical protein
MLATAWARASPRSKVGFFVAIVVLDNTAQRRVGRVPPAPRTPTRAILNLTEMRRRDSEEFDVWAWI